jgi:hypothetical protein
MAPPRPVLVRGALAPRGSDERGLHESWLDLKQATRRLLSDLSATGPSKNSLWLSSFITLGLADVASLSQKTSPLLQTLQPLGLAGAAGILATSLYDLKTVKTVEQRMDAANDLAWGVQGLLYLSSSSSVVQKLSTTLGFAGALTQTTVGIMRIQQGLKEHDRSKVTLGVLDLSGGMLWMGWDLLAWEQPLFVGSYVVLMVAREAYANKEILGELGAKTKKRVQKAYGHCEEHLNRLFLETRTDMERLLALRGALGP